MKRVSLLTSQGIMRSIINILLRPSYMQEALHNG